VPVAAQQANANGRLSAPEVAAFFVAVVERVEPVAEALCRERSVGINCDIQIVVDDRPGQAPNAFQTVDRAGRPIVGFTLALIADARNADEIAFVMGHEAAHHILNHIPKRQESAAEAARLAGEFARANGASPGDIRRAEAFGAEVGARSYSKEFELEADATGAEIAMLAGYDAVKGAAFFSRLPDPGDQFLGSHPPNAERQAQVARVVARLRAGGV
jgi:Zn-dependent protease with chaperone function